MKRILALGLAIVLTGLLCGCQMLTVDEMYVPPERSQDYSSLQSVINSAMQGMDYSAPVTGDHQQLVQMADLDGDDVAEYILYARGGDRQPLHILIFSMEQGQYCHSQTIDLTGAKFEKVEYAQIDGKPGLEIVVGSQVSDRVLRSVYVYSFADGEAQQLVCADYLNFLTVDLDANGLSDLFLLRPGPTENDRGIVELFRVRGGIVEKSLELTMSETANHLKRILVSKLHGGASAVYVASAVDEDTLITDVFTVVDGSFTNVSVSGDSGTSIKTMRNYFVYADDIDADGVMELPSLVPMVAIDTARPDNSNSLIRWYAMTPDGQQIDKLHTYHNFPNGWYIQLDNAVAPQISVVDLGNICDFYVWDQGAPVKAFSVYTLSGQSREAQATADGRFVLHKTETTTYAAKLDHGAGLCGFTQESVLRAFHLIREHWNTGQT